MIMNIEIRGQNLHSFPVDYYQTVATTPCLVGNQRATYTPLLTQNNINVNWHTVCLMHILCSAAINITTHVKPVQ